MMTIMCVMAQVRWVERLRNASAADGHWGVLVDGAPGQTLCAGCPEALCNVM